MNRFFVIKKTESMKLFTTSLFIIIFFCASLLGQQKTRYDKICYCSGNETPHRVVSYDNNIEILLALRSGKTKADLKRENISFTDSQLKLLQTFNLIKKEGGKYFIKIQIFDSIQTSELRKQTKLIAEKVFVEIESETQELIEYLNSEYNSDNSFSILFSYVFDGLIWKELENRRLIQAMEPDENSLTWSGYFWMIPYPRESKCGTNTSTEKNTSIYITNGVPWKFMKPLYDNDDLMVKMLSDINDYGAIKDSEVINGFSNYSLFDNKGIVQVPIIIENSKDKVFGLASSLSKELAKEFLGKVTISELTSKYSFIDNETALIVFYHEFMWDLMDLFEEKKIACRPKLFKDPSNSDLSDMSDLIFFVVNK